MRVRKQQRRADEPRISRPALETLVVFALALLGLAAIGLVLFVDAPVRRVATGNWGPYADDEWRVLYRSGRWQLWLALLGTQAVLWALLTPALWSRWRALSGRIHVWDLLATLTPIVFAVVAVALVRRLQDVNSPLPGHWEKLTIVTSLGAFPAIVAAVGMAGVGRNASKVRGNRALGEASAAYFGLRRDMRFFLAGAGAVIGAAVLGAGALERALTRSGAPAPEPILLYGLILSALLALVYAPVFAAVRRVGEQLLEALAPLPSVSHPAWPNAHARRRELRSFLELDVGFVDSVRVGAAVLAPLASGLIAVLLPKA